MKQQQHCCWQQQVVTECAGITLPRRSDRLFAATGCGKESLGVLDEQLPHVAQITASLFIEHLAAHFTAHAAAYFTTHLAANFTTQFTVKFALHNNVQFCYNRRACGTCFMQHIPALPA
jgi:hypothetical protein